MTDKPLKFDIVFTNPPGPGGSEGVCEFVEVEDRSGKSIQIGTWLERSDGKWVLAIDLTPDLDPTLQAIANFVSGALPSTPFEQLQQEVIDQLIAWVNDVRGKSEPKHHKSDCALNNGPAHMPGPCDCGTEPGRQPDAYTSEFPVVTHRAFVEQPSRGGLVPIASGDKAHCVEALSTWVKEHQPDEYEDAFVMELCPPAKVSPRYQGIINHWSDNKDAPEYQPEEETYHLVSGTHINVVIKGSTYKVAAPDDGEGGIEVSKVTV